MDVNLHRIKTTGIQMVKRVVVIGSGALATFFAYKWGCDYEVTVLGTWEDAINAINNNVVKEEGRLKVKAKLGWQKAKEPDLVVWLTKTYKNESALKQYKLLNWRCPILILQNGIGQKEIFQKELSQDIELLAGVTKQGAKLIAPGVVENTGDGEIFTELSNILTGFPVQQTAEFQTMQLEKLAINAVLNPICALFEVKNGEVREGEPLNQLKKLVKICFPYFLRKGIFSTEDEYLKEVLSVSEATKDNVNSMWADKLSGRTTEVMAILGPINQSLKSDFLQEIMDKLKP